MAAVGWLIKTLVSQRLTKEADAFRAKLQSSADQFKIQLQSSADVEIERLKASLQQVATEHQIRFAKLHEKRALFIAELHNLLVEAPAHAGQFIFQNVRDQDEAEKATRKVLELYRFINIHRIYFPDSVCGLLDKSVRPDYASRRPGEIDRICLDVSKAERLLGWNPQVSLLEGARRTVAYFKEHAANESRSAAHAAQ